MKRAIKKCSSLQPVDSVDSSPNTNESVEDQWREQFQLLNRRRLFADHRASRTDAKRVLTNVVPGRLLRAVGVSDLLIFFCIFLLVIY